MAQRRRPAENTPTSDDPESDPYPVRAGRLLRVRGVWAIPVIAGSGVLVLMSLFYIGSVVNPVGHLRGLPVSLVNEDRGATIGTQQISFGKELQSGLLASHSLTRRLSVHIEPLAAAKHRMDHNGAYATLVIPSNFTTSLLALTGAQQAPGIAAGLPRVELLSNRRAGSVGVQLASGVFEPAI